MAGLSLSGWIPPNADIRTENSIRKSLIRDDKRITHHTSVVSREIPDLTSNPMASLVMKQQPYLKDQGKDILDKLNSTTSAALEKSELRAQLRGLKEAADNHTDNVGAWVQAVKTSVKYGKNGYPMQPTPDAKENQEGLLTSQKDDYQHPVYSWPEAVIDAINAVESRPASPNGERNA